MGSRDFEFLINFISAVSDVQKSWEDRAPHSHCRAPLLLASYPWGGPVCHRQQANTDAALLTETYPGFTCP